MKPVAIFFTILTLTHIAHNVCSQPGTVKLSGIVLDAETGEPLPGANILIGETGAGVSAGSDGGFVIALPAGSYQLSVSHVGYRTTLLTIDLYAGRRLEIGLQSEAIEAGEVAITGERPAENVLKMVDNLALGRDDFHAAPQFFGQTDILKTLQLLPGVQGSGEGSTGIYVRGGAIDQNLIVLDHAPVFNTGHLFGFFSLFNPAAIGKVELIKGGIPASWGGRLSSVLRIDSRSGDFEELKGEAGLGLISGDVSLEGPLKKGKSSFIVSARRTYIDLLSKAVTGQPAIFNTGLDYYFDDLNGKLDFRLSSADRLAISGYTGHDDFVFHGKNDLFNAIEWKNTTASAMWDHFYSGRFYHTSVLYSGNYRLKFRAGIEDYLFKMFSSIKDVGFKQQWTLTGEKAQLEFGGEAVYHRLEPNNMQAKTDDMDFAFAKQETLRSLEEAVFLHSEWSLSENLRIAAGVRLSYFQSLGPFTRYLTNESMIVMDTAYYGKNEIIHTDNAIEPRISVRRRLNESSSLKLSYDRMAQYLHMAPVSSISLPTDIWVSGSEKIKPQLSNQYSLGYFRNFDGDEWETSASLYYKRMENQIEYRDGVIVGYSKGFNYDDNFIFGRGRAYGLEVLVRKNAGRLQGWLAYTLSRTERSMDEINSGKTFPAKYDRLHNLSIVGTYSINPKWSCSGAFVYSTGNALTLPVGRYIINGNIVNEYAGRNTFRMPPYHRMDFSATYAMRRGDRHRSDLVFSLYNVYNRKNPYYIYTQTEGSVDDYYLKVELKKVSLFPVLPAVSWRIYF